MHLSQRDEVGISKLQGIQKAAAILTITPSEVFHRFFHRLFGNEWVSSLGWRSAAAG